MSFDDDIRPPIPTISDKIIDNNFDDILLDETLDEETKQILINSRYEYLLESNKRNDNIISRKKIFSPLIIEMNKQFIDPEIKQIIEKNIINYANGDINIIKLDTDIYYEIYNIIKILNNEKINELIKPYSYYEYYKYIEIIEKSQQETINRINEISRRETILKPLLENLTRLSKFDPTVKIIKNKFDNNIIDYLNLNTNNILLNNEDKIELLNFIKTIRLTPEQLNALLEIF